MHFILKNLTALPRSLYFSVLNYTVSNEFIYNKIVHRVQQSKSKEQKAKLLHSCQVIYDAAKFISR